MNAIPPPMIRVSHFSKRLLITFNLSATLAPPKIATKGLTGFSTALPRKSISFCIKYPTAQLPPFARMHSVTPATEACALWDEPKASHT